ncbi:hypothetical protein ALP75_204158 [Pseudomonas syringae pv. actinidiae]|nr:hypothetical protein ALP75_204158 [Pseudomonas syringae pv. actinidiae]
MPRNLGDTVGNVVDDIDPGHTLLLEQKYGLAFLLTENCNQHVGAGHFALARALHVEDSALQHALKTQRWLSLAVLVVDGDQRRGGVDELLQIMLEFIEVCAAGT